MTEGNKYMYYDVYVLVIGTVTTVVVVSIFHAYLLIDEDRDEPS